MLHVDIQKTLGPFHLDARFDAQDGTMALLGASGCGKPVTLKCIAGILTPDEGQITLDGVTLFDSAARINLPPQKRRVGYLFQQYALFPNMTVRQNIAVAVREKSRRTAAAEELLRRMKLESVADLRPSQISGGQQQRCALARILASEPRAILLDEPFSALDSYLKQQLELELADTLSSFSGSVVWVSHDRGEVYRNCSRVCVMDNGRTQPSTDTAALFAHPATKAAARLSGCENFLDVVPEGEALSIPQWGVTLVCPGVSPQVRRAGIRARQVVPAQAGDENTFPCTVERVVEDLAASFEGRNEYIDRLCRYPLLIIDDFGMERGTEYGLEQVYNVIDSRNRSGKPLIVTTNLTPDMLENPQDTAHARIYDRLIEMCSPVCFTAKNFRKEAAKAKLDRLKELLK